MRPSRSSPVEPHLVVEQARDTGDRRGLAHEERERELDAARRRVEARDEVERAAHRGCATVNGAAPGAARSSSSITRRDMCVPLRSSGSAT